MTEGELYFSKSAEVCTSLVLYVSDALTAPVLSRESTNRVQGKEEKKKENEPVSEKMNEVGERERGSERVKKDLSKSNKFRGINVQTSPGISKGAPDSKLFKPAVQSGDTSIRISNSDRIDRPKATAQAETG